MVELETILTPVSLNGRRADALLRHGADVDDPAPLLGRSIAYERLVGSQLIQEDEPLPSYDRTRICRPRHRRHDELAGAPQAPYLR